MKFPVVVFDFDLTLADSTSAVVECSNHALAAMGFPPAGPETVRRTIGLTLPNAFREMTGAMDPALGADFARRFVERADEVMVTDTRIYPDVAETLAILRNSGARLGIVSTKYRYRIEAILARHGLARAVDTIIGGEDVSAHKPDPEGLVLLMRQLGTEPGKTVYIGDHVIDAELAQRAGSAFVAVRTGATAAEAWVAWAPLAIIDGIRDLVAVLVPDPGNDRSA